VPLLDRLVNNMLVKFIPYSLDTLTQLINIIDLHLVLLLLKYRPDFIINQIQIRTVKWPECWWEESWCFSLLRMRSHFNRSVMISVGVSVPGVTGLHFVNPGIKINGKYYRETLLKEELLPDMCDISEYFIFHFSRTARQLIVRRKQLIFFQLKHQLSFHQHSGHLTVQI